jgi:single-strand DNA-binding protein
MNFLQIAGHVAADPEERFTQGGKKVTTFRVGTKSRKAGQDVTIWWRVTVWDDQFKNMMPHIKKGSALIVFGELQKPEIYTDREGKPQVSLEMTAVSLQFSPFGRPAGQASLAPNSGQAPFGQHPENNGYSGFASHAAPTQSGPQGSTFDDEVPF